MAGSDDEGSLTEKRVYGAKAGRTDVYLAGGTGLVRVGVSGDRIGEFGVVHRGEVRDVAVLPAAETAGAGSACGPDLIAVATAADVLVGDAADDLELAGTGMGPGVAVGFHAGAVLAGGEDGVVRRLKGDAVDSRPTSVGGDPEPLGDAGEVRAISGPLVASDAGVFRVADGDLTNVGLADVRDVAGAGVPLAATDEGLYWLGNGWMDALPGAFEAVASDGARDALAAGPAGATDDALSVHEGEEWAADAWTAAALPVDERVVELAYGSGIAVAVTDCGTVCANAGDGWRHQPIGVREVGGVAVASVR